MATENPESSAPEACWQQLAAHCGSELNMLLQSTLYFLLYRFAESKPTGGQVRNGLFRDWQQYRCLLRQADRERQANLLLWQIPLGLLLSLKQQQQHALIEQFFSDTWALPLWYENHFVARSRRALILRSQRIEPELLAKLLADRIPGSSPETLPPAISENPLPESLPWAPPRLSPATKEQLLFQLRALPSGSSTGQRHNGGFRCSESELLLFLGFAPLSQLFLPSRKAGGQANQANQVPRPGFGVWPSMELGSLLARLDFQLFELYSGVSCHVEQMLCQEYREGLRDFWQSHWGNF